MKASLSSSTSPVNQMVRKARISTPFIFTLLAFIIFVAILYGQDLSCTFSHFNYDKNLQTLDNSSPNPKIHSNFGKDSIFFSCYFVGILLICLRSLFLA